MTIFFLLGIAAIVVFLAMHRRARDPFDVWQDDTPFCQHPSGSRKETCQRISDKAVRA